MQNLTCTLISRQIYVQHLNFIFLFSVKSKKATNANRDTEDGDEEEKDDEDGDVGAAKERYQVASGSEESVRLLALIYF